MKNVDKKRLEFLNTHSGSFSRRQFVGMGLLGATGSLLVPRLFPKFLGSEAFASDAASAGQGIAYLGFDLAGGAALPGNFLVGGKGGAEDLLGSYSLLGWNPRVNSYDSRFGLPMAKGDVSRIFQGMTTTMSPAAQQKFRMGSIAHIARDDSSDNPLSIIELLSSMPMMAGSKSAKGLGTTSASSGGNSRGVRAMPQYSPTRIGNGQDFKNLIQISGSIDSLSLNLKKRMTKALNSMSSSQMGRLGATSDETALVGSSYRGLDALLGDAIELDPRKVADIRTVYGINDNTNSTSLSVVRSGIVNCVLGKVTGPGVITIGGCDYHDGSQTTGDAKDLEIGQEIGRAIEVAHQRKIPLFIHIFTDGGCGSREGSRLWGSDRGEQCMSVIGYYDPNKTPTYVDKNRVQLGHYTQGQGAERETLLGSSPALVSYAVLANLMNLMGNLGEFNTYAPSPFTTAQLDSLLIFNKA